MPRVFYLHTEPLCQGRSTRGLRDICAELFVGKKLKGRPVMSGRQIFLSYGHRITPFSCFAFCSATFKSGFKMDCVDVSVGPRTE